MGFMKTAASAATGRRFASGSPGSFVESATAGGMGVEMLVGIGGLQQTIKALQGFTPTLQKNLKVRAVSHGRKKRRGLIGASVRTPARDKLDIDKDDRGYYPAVLEYGSAKRNIAPRAYLRKAKDASKEEVRYIFRNELSRLIDESASQLYHGKIDDRGVKIKAA